MENYCKFETGPRNNYQGGGHRQCYIIMETNDYKTNILNMLNEKVFYERVPSYNRIKIIQKIAVLSY